MKRLCRSSQNGYTLLLGLLVLMVIGGGSLVGGSLPKVNHRQAQTLELAQARTALISYAVNYIDHYGAQGAGVGHFPCPDTDTPAIQSTEPWHKDGPNPPCAKQEVATGWLPRHVNVADGRYHFHARQQQRIRYAISGRFINNPINRVVNSSVVGDIELGHFKDVIAVLALPPLDSAQSQNQPEWSYHQMATKSAYAVIRNDDIRLPVMQRVGSWLLEQLNNAMASRPTAAWQTDCVSSTEALVLYWLATGAANSSCAESAASILATTAWLEAVPIKKHWFVRNSWYKFVEIVIESACSDAQGTACEFVLDSVNNKTGKIHLRLKLVSSP